jgi:hypothetical protein
MKGVDGYIPSAEHKLGRMDGVREYSEGRDVELRIEESTNRPVVRSWYEGGRDNTDFDLFDLLSWLRRERPDLIG